ncbi:MAG: AMP-binding protein [Anaerolineales bacterium]|jgi:long-chain acyl-CoA synthetase
MEAGLTYLDKPWLKSYKLGPYKLTESLIPYPREPIFKVLDEAAARYPAQTAVLYVGETLNYKQLKTQVDKLANALAGLGVERGDRVSVFLPNCVEFIISDWAISKTGAAIVPISVLRSDEGLLHEVGSSGSEVIICREEMLDRILGIKDQCNLEHIIVTSTRGYNVEDLSISLPKGAHEFRKLLADSDPEPPQVDIDPVEDLCELAFTGGATGIPKGVMVTHFNRYSCICQGFPWLLKPILRGFVGKASVLVSVPLFHAYGHYAHQAGAYLGLRVILLPDPRDTDLMVESIREHRPFLIPGVPTQFMRIADANLSRMNVLPMSGSAPLPQEVSEAIRRKIGMPVSEGYGLTETSPLTHFNVSAFSKITGFIAKEKVGIGIPSPDTECRLIDPLSGEDVPFGEPGEILVRGPQIMKGYWPDPGSGLSEDGWLHTGDIAVMDEDGYFQIVDRIKDMVNVSGMKVYTNKVDEVLFKHPAVFMAACFGVPDPQIPGSERVAAAIQLKDEYKDKLTEEEIRSYCRQHLSPYEVPKFVEFRDSMPLTVTEKLFKKALREEVIVRMREKGELE